MNYIKRDLPPTILTIFGATGDLSSDYLLPALLRMSEHGLLPADFRLVAVGRKSLTSKSYLDFIVKKSSVLKKVPLKTRKHFLRRLTYFQGDFDQELSFAPLAEVLRDQSSPKHACYNRLYYFATSPQYFSSIAQILKTHGLLASCQEHNRQIRILVEKPFGFNLKSAQALNHLLLKYFKEDQIYRIDHYLGKETVQNLMVVRFANSLFEPLWNRQYIDRIEISVMEKDDAASRIAYYGETGALKDMVQNHILQMLALIAMEEPYNLIAQHIRDEKLRILQSLEPFSTQALKENLVLGQYEAYAKDEGLDDSKTETYAALKVGIKSPRWAGVPIYLRTGKALSKKLTEISIHFKELPRCLFKGCASNALTFRIQPDESVHLRINNKVPGFGVELHQGDLEFGYKQAFSGVLPSAYERLLLDFMAGDQRLFIRSDEIEAAWQFIDSITQNKEFKSLPVSSYARGSTGPKEAEEWIKKEGKEWWTK
jgi:glucose-6-phosphate 1-dehydrogenase